jgi:hypothetical protein
MTTKTKVVSVVLSIGLIFLLSSCVPALEVLSAMTSPTVYDSYSSDYYTPSYSTSDYASDYYIYDSYSLEVENNCVGADEYVEVYVDGIYYGLVYASDTFYGIPYGSHELMAIGTGYGGSTFSDFYFVDGDFVWTLC